MRRTLLLLTALVALPTPCLAGSYLSLGIGARADDSPGGDSVADRSGRMMVGARQGAFAIEAGGFGTELGPDATLVGVGVALKGHLTLAGPLSLFGRLGLGKGWLRTTSATADDSGSGHELGLGAQLDLGAGLGHASLWLEFSRQSFDLVATGPIDIDTSQVGIAIGF